VDLRSSRGKVKVSIKVILNLIIADVKELFKVRGS
jgi:hypothetical protein